MCCVFHSRATKPNFTEFRLQHSVMAPSVGVCTKLNADAQLKPSSSPKCQKRFQFKRLGGEVVSTNFTVQKARWTNKKQTLNFFRPPPGGGKVLAAL